MSGWADTSKRTSPTGQAPRYRCWRGRMREASAPEGRDSASDRRGRRRGLHHGGCSRGVDRRDRKGQLSGQTGIQRRSQGEDGPAHTARSAPARRRSRFRACLASRAPRWTRVLSRGRRSNALLRSRRCTLDRDLRRRGLLGVVTTIGGLLGRRPLVRKHERNEVLPGRRNRRRPGLEHRHPRPGRTCRRTRPGRGQPLFPGLAACKRRAWPRRTRRSRDGACCPPRTLDAIRLGRCRP